METLRQVQNKASFYLQKGLDNPYVMAVLKLTLIMYAAQIAPRLPQSVSTFLNNTFAKIAILFVILYLSERDFQLAIIISIAYVIGTNLIAGRGFLESFSPFSKDYEANPAFTLIEPKSIIYPGCHNITMKDLLAAFENDKAKLQDNVEYAYRQLINQSQTKDSQKLLEMLSRATGLPYNVDITDENAPYIATLLMYHGFQFSTTCTAPQ